MIRKILPDICIAALIAALAFFITAAPAPSLYVPSTGSKKTVAEPGMERRNTWVPVMPLDTTLKERNLFAESGSYDVKDDKKKVVLPENPYFLVAVLLGKEKKAVFREYTGTIRTLTAGNSLIDGAEITEINPQSVKVRKGKEVKELKLFDVRLRTADTAKQEAEKIGPARRR